MDPLLYSQVNIGILASALNQIVQGTQSGGGTSSNVTTLAMNTTLLVPMKDPSLREYNSTEFKASHIVSQIFLSLPPILPVRAGHGRSCRFHRDSPFLRL